MATQKPFGTLLIFDLKECNCKNTLDNRPKLERFLEILVNEIMGMKRIGSAIFEYIPANEFNIENDLVGYSITQIISMSSITIHICDISSKIYLDIFTCCCITDKIMKDIQDLVNFTFKPTKIEQKTIERL